MSCAITPPATCLAGRARSILRRLRPTGIRETREPRGGRPARRLSQDRLHGRQGARLLEAVARRAQRGPRTSSPPPARRSLHPPPVRTGLPAPIRTGPCPSRRPQGRSSNPYLTRCHSLMSTAGYPRLSMSLDVVADNTRRLAARLLDNGITLVGVTKAVDGEPRVGQAMLEAGAAGLADSRLPSLVRLAAHALAPLTLIRPPQPDELEATAQVADRVLLSDVAAARVLGEHAPGAPIELLLTLDLGDRREGVLPEAVPGLAAQLARLPGRAARRHRRELRLPVGPAPVAPAVRASRAGAGRHRSPVRRRAAALYRRHLLRAVPAGLPAALQHRAPLRGRPALRSRLRVGHGHRGPDAHRPRAHGRGAGVRPQAAGAARRRRP